MAERAKHVFCRMMAWGFAASGTVTDGNQKQDFFRLA